MDPIGKTLSDAASSFWRRNKSHTITALVGVAVGFALGWWL